MDLKGPAYSICIISFVLLFMLAGCSGKELPAITRTIVSETPIAQVPSPYRVDSYETSSDAKHIAYVTSEDGVDYLFVDGVAVAEYSGQFSFSAADRAGAAWPMVTVVGPDTAIKTVTEAAKGNGTLFIHRMVAFISLAAVTGSPA